MGTRSTIALEFADGTIGQVYCHWDGYLEHNGKILRDHYSDPFKLRDLIDLGDLSMHSGNFGTKHDFDSRVEGAFTFYMRDHNEVDTEARYFTSYQDYLDNYQDEEYNYILRRDGNWYVSEDNGFRLLDKVLKQVA